MTQLSLVQHDKSLSLINLNSGGNLVARNCKRLLSRAYIAAVNWYRQSNHPHLSHTEHLVLQWRSHSCWSCCSSLSLSHLPPRNPSTRTFLVRKVKDYIATVLIYINLLSSIELRALKQAAAPAAVAAQAVESAVQNNPVAPSDDDDDDDIDLFDGKCHR